MDVYDCCKHCENGDGGGPCGHGHYDACEYDGCGGGVPRA